ncbi:MAG: response regulator [Saprospiraceae bacterium]
MPIKVFNADDHPMLRKGVTDLIKESPDLEWVGSAANGQEAIEKIRALRPEIAILDIEMPHYSGIEVAKILLAEGTPTRFIIFTLFEDENFLRNALAVGIKGYLLKDSSETEMLAAIRTVHAGKPYVNPNLAHILSTPKTETPPLLAKLTAHEFNILKLIAQHKTSNEIANMLFISPKTVGNLRTKISKKLELDGKQNALLKWVMEHKELFT